MTNDDNDLKQTSHLSVILLGQILGIAEWFEPIRSSWIIHNSFLWSNGIFSGELVIKVLEIWCVVPLAESMTKTFPEIICNNLCRTTI